MEVGTSAKMATGAVISDGATIVSRKAMLDKMTSITVLEKIPADRFFECASSHQVNDLSRKRP